MADLDIDNICRLCCEKKGRLRSLFEQKPAKDSLSLQQIILDVTRLEVEPGDGMPQKICNACSDELMKMHETIDGYRANDLKLRQQLGDIRLLPLVEIKEEEVDMEVLESTCQMDMMVEDITIKPELEEEYLDYEEADDDESGPADEDNAAEENDSDSDSDGEAIQHDDEPKEKKPKRIISKKKAGKRKYTKRGTKRLKKGSKRSQDFKCYICMSDSHGTPEALLIHLKSSHSDMLPYTCPDCVTETVVIKTVGTLNNHKRQHLNPEKCPHCDRRYINKNSVDLHIQMYHKGGNDPNPSPCEHCGKVFPTKNALIYHMRIHTSAVSCEICGKVFRERSKLNRHIENRHEQLKKFECHICQKKLASMSAVQNHIDTYHSSQVYTCSYCPKTFSSKLTHRYHEKKHVENPNYVATKDWKEYYTVLEPRLDEKEGIKVEKLKKCNLCGEITPNIGPHMHKVHFPTEYKCEICNKSFQKKQSHTRHMQEHEDGGKAHPCPICGREFSIKYNLITHLRTKKHQDHPLAQAMLSTVRPSKLTKPKTTQVE